MADNARELTDKRLAAMSKRLTSEYKTAQKDLSERFSKYMAESEKRLESLKTALSEAVKSGDKKAIAKAEKTLAQAKMDMTIGNKRYREMIDDLTTKMAEINQTALDYVNGQMSYIYRVNYNQGRDAADEIGMSFSAMNEEAVARRVRDGDIKLPKKKMSIPEDKRWNTKQLNSAVIQGIMQGESMDKIAKRILPVVDNNRNAAIRNARTMVTGAENEGRQDCWEQLAEDGAVLKRVWISTPDSRTREAHLFMDGQEVDLDEPFVDGDGNQLNFPGDPTAAPETVYNCRCSMRVKVIGFRKSNGDIVRVADRDRQGMHQKAIEREREKREAEEKPKQPEFVIVQGKDISTTWERRPDDFEFEIQDVINAQGFDGKPRVVDEEEFNRYVDESKFIAQRTYSAPDQETLDMYRDQLYHGEWYVDCSTGGSQYGQGMYCAADYTGRLTDGIQSEMEHYIELGKQREAENALNSVLTTEDLRKAIDSKSYLVKQKGMPSEEEAQLFLRGQKEHTPFSQLSEREQKIQNDMYNNGHYSILSNAYQDVQADFRLKYQGFSFTETLTLDPSANIITYQDAFVMKTDEVLKLQREAIDSVGHEMIESMNLNGAERDYMLWGLHISKEIEPMDLNKAMEFGKTLTKEQKAEYQNKQRAIQDAINEKIKNSGAKELSNMDVGAYAAVKGYDAINAEGHGKSGSYTVILNRTKVIFKRDKK